MPEASLNGDYIAGRCFVKIKTAAAANRNVSPGGHAGRRRRAVYCFIFSID
jgi:hypothetical protein